MRGKRGREEEEGDEEEGQQAAAARAAAAVAAEAAQRAAAKRAQYSDSRGSGGDSTSAFLEEMQRREAAYERSTGSSTAGVGGVRGLLLLGREGPASGAGQPAPRAGVDQGMRDAAVGVLVKAMDGAAGVSGLEPGVLQGVARLCEWVAHSSEARESRNIYRCEGGAGQADSEDASNGRLNRICSNFLPTLST